MPFRDFREFLDASRKPAAVTSSLRSKMVIVVDPPANESVTPAQRTSSALVEHGMKHVEVAATRGWQDYDLPKPRKSGAA